MSKIEILLTMDLQPTILEFQDKGFARFVELSQVPPENLDKVVPVRSSELKLIVISSSGIQKFLDSTVQIALRGEDSQADLPLVPMALIYSPSDPSLYFDYLMRLERVNHLLSIESEKINDEVKSLYEHLANDREKGVENCIFKMSQFSHLVDVQKYTMVHTEERRKVYDEITRYAESLNGFSGFSGIVNTVASELITNAFYDGKRFHGTGLEKHGDRSKEFALDPGESIEFMFGKEDDYLWIIVQDPFGSVDRNTLINALHRAAKTRTAKLDSKGGAGLGLIMLYEWCSTMHFRLSKGIKTIVACKLKITNRNKIFSSEKNSLHIFLDEG